MDVIDGQWIRERLTGRRGEIAELAAHMGIDQDKVSKILAGTRKVQAEEMPQVVSFFSKIKSQRELLEPLMLRRIETSDEFLLPDDDDTRSTLVPVYDVHASAGGGSVVGEELVAHSLAFPPDYLRRLTSSKPDQLAIISVKGESMEPTLLDDDIVLLDASKTNLGYDGLFVLRFDDTLHVKRVGRSASKGHIMVISDNKDLYPPLEISRAEVEAVGKVLWYGRKV